MSTEQKHAALMARLNQERAAIGSVNPKFSYYERLVRAAQADRGMLESLYQKTQSDGGFHGC